MLRGIQFIVTVVFFFATVLTAQNQWEQLGAPVRCGSPGATPSQISSGYNQASELTWVYVVTDAAVYRSYQHGEFWEECRTEGANVVEAAADDGEIAWIGVKDDGVYQTINTGDDWIDRTYNLINLNLKITSIAMNTGDHDVVVVGCEYNGATIPRIFLWDGVNNWDDIDITSEYSNHIVKDLAIYDDGSGGTPVIYAAIWGTGISPNGIYESPNLGVDWYELENAPDFEYIADIELSIEGPNDYLYVSHKSLLGGSFKIHQYNLDTGDWVEYYDEGYVGSSMLIEVFPENPYSVCAVLTGFGFLYEDPPLWVPTTNGFEEVTFGGLEIDLGDPQILYATTSQCLYRSTDGGLSWQQAMVGMVDFAPLGKVAVQGDYLVAVNPYAPQYLYESTDGGETITFAKNIITIVSQDVVFYRPELLYEDAYHILGSSFSSTVTIDARVGIPILEVIFSFIEDNATVNAILVHPYPETPNYVLMGGHLQEQTLFHFFISDDYGGGGTWDYYEIEGIGTTQAIAADPTTDPGSTVPVYYAAGSDGVFKSDAFPFNWYDISDGLPEDLLYSDMAITSDGSLVYLASSDGIYQYNQNWLEASEGIPASYRYIIDLEMGNRDDFIFCVGVYESEVYKVFATGNGGQQWFDITGELPTGADIQNIRHDENDLFVGTYEGIYRFTVDFIADPITVPTVWSGDILVVDDINVSSTLTIQAGTNVQFISNAGLIIEEGGSLVTTGTSHDLVVFESWLDDEWDGISVNGSADFEYCDISGTGDDDEAIFCTGSLEMSYCNLGDNGTGLTLMGAEASVIEQSTIEYNGSGIEAYACDGLSIINNKIKYNTLGGIKLNDCTHLEVADNVVRENGIPPSPGSYGGILLDDTSPTMMRNYIRGNGRYQLWAIDGSFPVMYGGDGAYNALWAENSDYWPVYIYRAFPLVDGGHNNIINCELNTTILIYDDFSTSGHRNIRYNYWGTDNPQEDQFYPSSVDYIYTPFDPEFNDPPGGYNLNSSWEDSLKILFDEALQLEEVGLYEEAVEVFQFAAENYPDYMLGLASLDRIKSCGVTGNLDLVEIGEYFLDLSSQPINDEFCYRAYLNCISTKIHTGDYTSAIADFEDILLSGPNLVDSILTVIDAGMAYLLLELNSGPTIQSVSGNNIGTIASLKPESIQDYRQKIASLWELLNETGAAGAPSLPTKCQLYQNVPNPFNSLTSITFDLPEASHVCLNIYNVQGRHVATLLNGTKNAGTHKITLNATDLASGIYIYQISTDNFMTCRKMVLIK